MIKLKGWKQKLLRAFQGNEAIKKAMFYRLHKDVNKTNILRYTGQQKKTGTSDEHLWMRWRDG